MWFKVIFLYLLSVQPLKMLAKSLIYQLYCLHLFDFINFQIMLFFLSVFIYYVPNCFQAKILFNKYKLSNKQTNRKMYFQLLNRNIIML